MAESITLAVTGMKCGGCESIVSAKLNSLDGVISVTASSKDKQVTVDFDPAKLDIDSISDAIESAGYKVVDGD